MNRQLDYDEVKRDQRARFIGLKAELENRRGPRRRPRDPEILEELLRLDMARLADMYQSGERRWIAPRVIAVRL
jgi:hypothetical protein